ncbi:CAX4 (YGR036C) [Zygosaccharomyces parabailii]|uniref:BN860_07118g1_1 n=1 Tax=Zygosaccharomyces bailii (strain CLIB 213 / ATCC 58445 / CBS 680 / BCRC 21525 / NBRC 1098 / NCYC 1416 / NRRL Y-2227) TaxID=1333698 RepID=A0A8J2X641_ZYGB2|nr:CAX4 (YGR036C) [Zygosaccharomyces parabailii]CDF88311.1 BN860_07118g1_1 [Zygosaccharomyces bailii CLIB 213]CDH08850.1 related to Dolichyldiphosphatase [Zygosaccharomyces bailii ISA1307]SJM81883.1 related to Dolichyldiphosphatase [Zygosaccharomyces bailii]
MSFNPNLIPFDDTYILYDRTDPVSFASAYFSLLPMGILIFELSWFITTRELEACIMAAGQVANELFNNIVKDIVKQPRPYSFGDSFQQDTMRSCYGMPSAHSQFMGFFCTYTSLRFCYRWKGLTRRKRLLGIAFVSFLAFCVCFSRVYLHYHSLQQVLVGAVLGSATASTYYVLVAILREMGIIDWLLTWRLCDILYVKDSCNLAPLTLKDEKDAYSRRIHATPVTRPFGESRAKSAL